MPHENGQHFWTFWLKSARQKVWKNEVEMAEAGQCVGRVQAWPRILQSLQMALTSERIAFQLNKQKVKGLALLVSGLGGRDWHGLLPERAFNGGITVGIWSTGVVPPFLILLGFCCEAKLNSCWWLNGQLKAKSKIPRHGNRQNVLLGFPPSPTATFGWQMVCRGMECLWPLRRINLKRPEWSPEVGNPSGVASLALLLLCMMNARGNYLHGTQARLSTNVLDVLGSRCPQTSERKPALCAIYDVRAKCSLI